uniref:Uncharacterized protein n=1 Tax=Anguilla anguilla TaxID=7936 RepID=A0A0E9QWV1_ANGAN
MLYPHSFPTTSPQMAMELSLNLPRKIKLNKFKRKCLNARGSLKLWSL